MNHHQDTSIIEKAVDNWLDQVVIGLNLCPFAAFPRKNQKIRLKVSQAHDHESLLADIQEEIMYLDGQTIDKLETTLVIVPYMLQDFYDYNDALGLVEAMLEEMGWEGHYQVASFHPDYQFAETEADDAENLTNRAPYPIFHLLRERSVEKAIETYEGDVADIPEINIEKVCSLTADERHRLFPHLKK